MSNLNVNVRLGCVLMNGEEVKYAFHYPVGMGTFFFLRGEECPSVVRFSRTGNQTYHLQMIKDGEYILSSESGRRVKPASEEADPIRRVLRLCEVPLSNIKISSGMPLEITEEKENLGCYLSSGHANWEWATDGKKVMSEGESWRKSQHCYGEKVQGKISNFSYAFTFGWRTTGGSSLAPFVGQVYVTDKTNVKELGQKMVEHLFGPGATLEMREAQEAGALGAWVASRVQMSTDPCGVKIGEKKFSIFLHEGNLKLMGQYYLRPEQRDAVARGFNNLPYQTQIGILGGEQKKFAEALLDPTKGLEWLAPKTFTVDGRLMFDYENGMLVDVQMLGYCPVGLMAVFNRPYEQKDLFLKEVLARATELGNEVKLINTTPHDGQKHVLVAEGVTVYCDIDNVSRYDNVRIEGVGKFVWCNTDEARTLKVWKL
ncbi:MAG: hypothetical protein NTV02_03910 [Candidatus Zambryskibacteria bacterium]|nr:hypothetical protein [Candidatus Zambryskibacteria bacterium]